MEKTFVLDTNVLLHSYLSLESFEDNNIVLPMAVIEELDRFKKNQDELGRNARQVIRRLDELRIKGSLRDGVPLDNAHNNKSSGTLRVVSGEGEVRGLDMNVADNRIIRVAYNLYKQNEKVIFVSKDINARIKGDALGMAVMDFEKEKVNFDELFTGYSEEKVSGDIIDKFYKSEEITLEDKNFYPNEFVMLIDETNPKHTALAKAGENNVIQRLMTLHDDKVWNIHPRSKEQRIAIDLLMDPEIQLITLVGQAGTGKTLLALATGLELVIHKNTYDRILVSRPIIPLGKDIGFLPGDKEEKIRHWMQPIFDNLEYLMRREKKDAQAIRKSIDDLMKSHKLDLEALTYIRGRSIPRQYVIVDEAQNLTPHEVKTIVSRAGEGTKMVLTGDPYQIDNPYLDASSNGLTYAVERLKGQAIHGHVTLRKSERSDLSAFAAEYL